MAATNHTHAPAPPARDESTTKPENDQLVVTWILRDNYPVSARVHLDAAMLAMTSGAAGLSATASTQYYARLAQLLRAHIYGGAA